MQSQWVGYALLLFALGACAGHSEASRPEADTAGNSGVSGSAGGNPSGGASPDGASGSPTVDPRVDAGASGANASAGDASVGGSATSAGGSTQSAGSATGGSSSGGYPSGTPWCPDSSVCRSGVDQRLAPGEPCPVGRDCYSDDWCGKAVQCVKYVADPSCTDMPTCDAGQLSFQACLGAGICETRVACGKSILCETVQQGCQPGTQKDRVYAAIPAVCATLSIFCPEGSSAFTDECGCGCEQPTECPDSVNCQPTTGGTSLSNLCDSAECPFTERAN